MDNFAILRISDNGKKTAIWPKISIQIGTNVLHCDTASTNACMFCATKTVYAATKPSWDSTMEAKIARRILGPYRMPPMSPKDPGQFEVGLDEQQERDERDDGNRASVMVEKSNPPLKKALPRKSTPVPTNDLSSIMTASRTEASPRRRSLLALRIRAWVSLRLRPRLGRRRPARSVSPLPASRLVPG